MSSIPIPKQTQRLVDTLVQQTAAGRHVWEKGSAETEFVFAREAGSVIISSVDGDGAAPYELRILDPSGTVVESYSTEDEGSEYFRALYETARRSTAQPSPVVESLVKSLSDDDIPF